jgi:hypothetical protein
MLDNKHEQLFAERGKFYYTRSAKHGVVAYETKGKVAPVLNSHLEDVWGNRGIAPPFSTSELYGGEWSDSCLGRFTPGTHWMGGWVGPRTGLDVVEKRKVALLCRESNPGRPARSLSLYRLSHLDSQHTKMPLLFKKLKTV